MKKLPSYFSAHLCMFWTYNSSPLVLPFSALIFEPQYRKEVTTSVCKLWQWYSSPTWPFLAFVKVRTEIQLSLYPIFLCWMDLKINKLIKAHTQNTTLFQGHFYNSMLHIIHLKYFVTQPQQYNVYSKMRSCKIIYFSRQVSAKVHEVFSLDSSRQPKLWK